MWHFCLLIYSTMRFWHTGSLLYSLRRRERPAIVSTPRVQMQEGQLLCAQPKVLDDPGVCRSAVLLALGAGLGVGAVLMKVENRLDRMGEVAHKLGGVDCPRVFCARASSAGKQECAGKRREPHARSQNERARASHSHAWKLGTEKRQEVRASTGANGTHRSFRPGGEGERGAGAGGEKESQHERSRVLKGSSAKAGQGCWGGRRAAHIELVIVEAFVEGLEPRLSFT
jgi:hypothetical protein